MSPIKVPCVHRTVLCPSSGLWRLHLLLLQGNSSGVQHHGKGKRRGWLPWPRVVLDDLDIRTINLIARSSLWEDSAKVWWIWNAVLPQSPVSFSRPVPDCREPLKYFYWKCNPQMSIWVISHWVSRILRCGFLPGKLIVVFVFVFFLTQLFHRE